MSFSFHQLPLGQSAPTITYVNPVNGFETLTTEETPTNSGITPTMTYFNSTTPVFLKAEQPVIINPTVQSNIVFQDGAGNVGEIGYDSAFGSAGRMGIIAENSILLVPNNTSGNVNGGVLIQDGVENPPISGLETYKVSPSISTGVLKIDNSQRFFQALSGSPITVDNTFIGRSTYITGVSTVNMPPSGLMPSGAEVIFYVAPSQTTEFKNNNGNTILTATTTATQLAQVTCFTPNQGTNWYAVNVLYATA
jgi:hypothetical protein